MVSKPKSLYKKILQAENPSTVQEIVDRENSKQIRVHMPAKVVAVNGNTVDVEIQGQEDSGYGYYVNFPLLLDLPIVYNNYTRKAYIITPIQVGDTGLVEFLDFNTSNFNNDGNALLTDDQFPHSLNNGVFINGFIPTSNVVEIAPKNTDLISKDNNPNMVIEPNDEIYDRPKVQNEDGTYSTAQTISITIDKELYDKFDLPPVDINHGYVAIIPTVYDEEHHTYEESIARFYKTGLHFGIFLVTLEENNISKEDIEKLEKYTVDIHNAQEKYSDGINNAITIGLRNKTFKFDVDDTGSVTINGLSVKLKSDIDTTVDTPNFYCTGSLGCGDGANGTFNSADGKTITVTNGVVTNIE